VSDVEGPKGQFLITEMRAGASFSSQATLAGVRLRSCITSSPRMAAAPRSPWGHRRRVGIDDLLADLRHSIAGYLRTAVRQLVGKAEAEASS
jgi:hypothetical protein